MSVVEIKRDEHGRIGDRYDAQIIELYEAGWPLTYVANYFGISQDTVRTRLTANEIPIRPRESYVHPSKLSHEEYERTILLYKLGLSAAEVGAQLGVSKSAIRHRLIWAGVPMRTRGESLALAYQRGRRKSTKGLPRGSKVNGNGAHHA